MSDFVTRDVVPEAAVHWDTLARRAARRRDEQHEPIAVEQLLSFEIDGAPYAIPVERVREIVRIGPITPVPRVPADVRGVISLRGEIVQVVDLRRRLGSPPAEIGRASRIVVVFSESGRLAGLLVDAVTEVLRVAQDALRPPACGDSGAVVALCTQGGRFVSLIDLERILGFDAGD